MTEQLVSYSYHDQVMLIELANPEKKNAAMSFAQSPAKSSPIAMQILKWSINDSYEMSEQVVLTSEREALGFFWGLKIAKKV